MREETEKTVKFRVGKGSDLVENLSPQVPGHPRADAGSQKAHQNGAYGAGQGDEQHDGAFLQHIVHIAHGHTLGNQRGHIIGQGQLGHGLAEEQGEGQQHPAGIAF